MRYFTGLQKRETKMWVYQKGKWLLIHSHFYNTAIFFIEQPKRLNIKSSAFRIPLSPEGI